MSIIILASRNDRNTKTKTTTQELPTNGVWLSLARAPGLGPGGRRFESCHPDLSKVTA